jgi:hypothetical protein
MSSCLFVKGTCHPHAYGTLKYSILQPKYVDDDRKHHSCVAYSTHHVDQDKATLDEFS